MNNSSNKQAFSLIELSIVLVILGLLVGGVLAGQSLIRAAELRSVTAAIQNYTAAMFSFRDKYFQMPGDMNNARSFWPACTDHTNNNCNGDGDGIMDNSASCSDGVQSVENNRAWQHLQLAGLIEGEYSLLNANCSSAVAFSIPGSSVPRLRMSNSGITFYEQGGAAGFTYPTNVFLIGAKGGNGLEANLLKPEEAWNIDTKMDDGVPLQGKLRAIAGQSGTCVTSAAYALTNSALGCRIINKIN